MYTTRKMPEEFDAADRASKALLREVLKEIPPSRSALIIPATHSWYSNPERRGNLYFVREGMISYSRKGRQLFSFNDGDLIGVENVFCSSDSALTTEFAVIVDEYPAEDFFTKVNQAKPVLKHWNEYLAQQFKLFSIMLASVVNEQEGFVPELRFYAPGEEIIEQGGQSEEIFTLVEGGADVMMDGLKVGEVGADEIFGALAGLTGNPRMASVVSTSESMIVVLTKSQLKHLMLTRPNTVIKLLEDMARILSSSSDKAKILQHLKV